MSLSNRLQHGKNLSFEGAITYALGEQPRRHQHPPTRTTSRQPHRPRPHQQRSRPRLVIVQRAAEAHVVLWITQRETGDPDSGSPPSTTNTH
ncbi:hypothetical protein [Kibdelosporangium philippinense]|uniref:hypothetical protein n=1 Tax=Kibdelosporangium philippinense TaxID=211113 RepID=UPI00360D9568